MNDHQSRHGGAADALKPLGRHLANAPSLPMKPISWYLLSQTLAAGSCRMPEPDDALVPTTELSEIADKRMSSTLQLKLIVPILSIYPSWIKRHHIPRIHRPPVPSNVFLVFRVTPSFGTHGPRGHINDMNVCRKPPRGWDDRYF